jgi:hypothetical protein
MKKRILALLLCMIMCLSTVSLFASCGGKKGKPDALVLMSEELDGLFNPFFSTTAADGTIVSMTQIGMITNNYVNGEIGVAFGDNEATVVKDYQSFGKDFDGDGKDDETMVKPDRPNKEIRQRAIKARLNLWQVAERAGISEATMCRWMRTELKPADPRRILLLSALKELLESDYRTIYEALDKPHRKAFWRNIIKEFTVDENRQIVPESVIFFD